LDAAVIPTAIHAHRPMVETALAAGFDVMVEKPAAATVQDARAMIAARDRAGRQVAVGFQSQSGALLRAVKQRLVDGRLGQIRRVSAACFQKRTDKYYARNAWAGKIKVDGAWDLDGPVMNAMAHQLMNALWLAGPTLDASAAPRTVAGECYHVNPIEADDLSAMRATLAGAGANTGAELYFAVTYCWGGAPKVELVVEGDKGRVVSDAFNKAEIFLNGRAEPVETLTGSNDQAREDMWRNVVAVFTGKEKSLHVPLETAYQHTLTADCAFLSSGGFRAVPDEYVEQRRDATGETWRTVKGLDDWFARAAAERRLFSELGLPWAAKPKMIEAAGIKEFAL
jgi:predicted dehydrogenase